MGLGDEEFGIPSSRASRLLNILLRGHWNSRALDGSFDVIVWLSPRERVDFLCGAGQGRNVLWG